MTLAVAVVLVFVCGASLPAVADSDAGDTCEERGRTLRENAQVRVYEFEFPGDDRDRTFFSACDKGTGELYGLGGFDDTYTIIDIRDTIQVAGRAVFFGFRLGDEDGEPLFPLVGAVRFPLHRGAGRAVSEGSANIDREALVAPPDRQEREVVCKLVATKTAVAWSTCKGRRFEPVSGCSSTGFSRIVVQPSRDFRPSNLRARAGSPVQLAVGRGVDPRSLRLSHNRTRVVWTDNGRKRSAKLPT